MLMSADLEQGEETITRALVELKSWGLLHDTPHGVECPVNVRDLASKTALAEGSFGRLARAVQWVRPTTNQEGAAWGAHLPWQELCTRALRDFRIALLSHDEVAIRATIDLLAVSAPGHDPFESLLVVHHGAADPTAFARLIPDAHAAEWCGRLLTRGLWQWDVTPELRAGARRYAKAGRQGFRILLAFDALLAGEQPELGDTGSSEWAPLVATRELMLGSPAAAEAGFARAVKASRSQTGKHLNVSGIPLLFHALALCILDTPNARDELKQMVQRGRWNPALHQALELLVQLSQTGGHDRARDADEEPREPVTVRQAGPPEPWAVWVTSLANYWRNGPAARRLSAPRLEVLAADATRSGWLWMVAQCQEQIRLLLPTNGQAPPTEGAPKQTVAATAIVAHRRRKAEWELALDELERLSDVADAGGRGALDDSAPRERLTWRVRVGENAQLELTPYVQKLGARGWTAGRAVSLDQLRTTPPPPWLAIHDQAIVPRLMVERPYHYTQTPRTHWALGDAAAGGLVGHPLLFDEQDPRQSIELANGTITMRVDRVGADWRITCDPWPPTGTEMYAVRHGAGRILLYKVSQELRSIAELIGPGGIIVPLGEAERIARLSSKITPLVAVQSELSGDQATRKEADPRLYLQLRKQGERLRIDVQVRPLGSLGPWFAPGSGGKRVMAQVAAERLEAERDLAGERTQFEALLSHSAALSNWHEPAEPHWLETLEEVLRFVLELSALGDGLVVEWHGGDPFRVRGTGASGGLRIQVTTAAEWLDIRGELVVDEQHVATLRELLDAEKIGGFAKLQSGDFIALSDQLRRELAALESFTLPTKKGSKLPLRLHPLAVHFLDPLGETLSSLELDDALKARMVKVRRAQDLNPVVPASLKAELRGYQLEGFRWLCRQGEWGAGCCLADDMGLGKTVQVLALLLWRAKRGPALVVAPLSVCSTWREEAGRFAPSLRFITLSEEDQGAREDTIAKLGPNDVLVCSYGLMVREVELLASRTFDAVILDEAQAIKNDRSQRAQAACRLRATVRIVATGTPIENRLSELWSQFQFLNPGLLGTAKHFTAVYARPIELDRDPSALESLRRRIRPFILRRTKTEVLSELPPRTEIVRRIEAPAAEADLYEALRRGAVAQLTATQPRKGTDGASAKAPDLRFAILAALTKLRRACCHPALASPGCNLPGAKFEAFAQLARELADAGHRVLVFSQFVDVLTIARKVLTDTKLSYQYLDGSTPAKAREERVRDFQRGVGDVFLISTKAGGQGLTLTAADYVIHLDPWWNPAVEDQASDRAHRIGQTRPVTVYRLVMANTIEESILELHTRKRDLADSLLSGSDTAAQLDVADLMALLEETHYPSAR